MSQPIMLQSLGTIKYKNKICVIENKSVNIAAKAEIFKKLTDLWIEEFNNLRWGFSYIVEDNLLYINSFYVKNVPEEYAFRLTSLGTINFGNIRFDNRYREEGLVNVYQICEIPFPYSGSIKTSCLKCIHGPEKLSFESGILKEVI